MNDDIEPSPADLATRVDTLPIEDRRRLHDYWDAVIAEELGACEPPTSPSEWSAIDSSERPRLRRHERRAGNTVLRLVTSVVDTPVASPTEGEAA